MTSKKLLLLSFLAVFLGVFWFSPVFAKIDSKIESQINAKVGSLFFGDKVTDANTNIVVSDDKNYDFMNVTDSYKIYFKQDPITNKANIKYQRGDSWVEFDTLSKVQIAGEKKTINAIASANDWKYCKYLLGLCNVFGYFKLWGTAAISFNQTIPEGNVAENQTSRFAYPKVWENKTKDAYIDAEYEISPQTFLEEFVLNKFQDIDSVSQNLVLHNAYLKQEGDRINFYNSKTNAVLFFIPKPKMYEAGFAGNPKSEIRNPKESYGLHFDLTKIDNTHYILTKTLDADGKQWLASSERIWPVVIDASIGYGSEYVFNSAETEYVFVAKLDSTHFVAGYRDLGNSNYGTAIMGTISGTTISYGSESVFNAVDTYVYSLTALDSTHFVAGYTHSELGYLNIGTAILGTVNLSNGNITFDPEYWFNWGSTGYISLAALDSTHFVAGYKDSGNSSYGRATYCVVTISEGTMHCSGTAAFSEYTETNSVSLTALDSTHFVVGYHEYPSQYNPWGSFGKAKVGTVVGGSITYGSEYEFSAAYGRVMYNIFLAALDSTHFVVAYSDTENSRYGTTKIGTVSGDDIAFGSANVFNAASSGSSSVTGLDSTHFVIGYANSTSQGGAKIGTVSGGNVLFGPEYVFSSTGTYISLAALDSTHFVAGYRDFGNSSYGTAIVGTYATNTSAPVFSSGPSDGGSSATTPTNVGSNTTFTATATDADGNNYYLAICKTEAVTANNGAAPTCTGGNWCVSGSTASGAAASCTRAALAGDSETNAWYAYVCDYDDASACSSSSQGSGDNGSPFVVNHSPNFSAISDTPDPVTTGSQVTFTATASDPDTGDTVTLYVCKSASFSASTCADGEWCHTSAVASNPTCNYTTQAGDGTGAKNYYGYVVDNNGVASTYNPRSSTFTISEPVWACGDALTDTRDSKTYATVSIGTQCWMRENINVGTKITSCTGGYVGECATGEDTVQNQGVSCSSIQKYCYGDDEANCTTYGGLYQWNQAMCNSLTEGVQGICPTGWHIPTHDEFTALERAICTSDTCATDFPYDTSTTSWRGTDEGTSLKTVDTTHFSGLLAGIRVASTGNFTSLSSNAYFWTSLRNNDAAWNRQLAVGNATVSRGSSGAQNGGMSVRCIQNSGSSSSSNTPGLRIKAGDLRIKNGDLRIKVK